jgi:16S rRNA processing protein RimM
MITRDELISIGHYNKPHGVAGEISATVDVDFDVLRSLSCLVSEVDGIFVPFFVNACRPKSGQTVLLTIDGINNETEATLLVNADIYALKR